MSKFRIAVVGGGLAGSTLANGLNKHPQLEFKVFESGPAFKERGAHVALGPTAQRSLELIGSDVRKMLDNAHGVMVASLRLRIGEGPDNGEFCFDIGADEDKSITVHRAQFLGNLLKPIPEERLCANKKLLRIRTEEEHARAVHTLFFADNTTEEFDAVIGADGVHSTIRAYILGQGHPDIQPVFSGFWNCRNLVSYDLAKEKLGDRCNDPALPRQNLWAGDGAFLLHNLIDDGARVSVVAAGIAGEDLDPQAWTTPLTRGFLDRHFANWGPFGRAYSDCLLDQPEPVIFSMWESGLAPTYHRGSVCMMGDAAHATSPWLGSGAVMAIEDALILERLLGKVHTHNDIVTAFETFDELRRPRTQQVIEMSSGTGTLFCGKDSRAGLDPRKLRDLMPQRWHWIWHMDVDQHVKEAEMAYERRKTT